MADADRARDHRGWPRPSRSPSGRSPRAPPTRSSRTSSTCDRSPRWPRRRPEVGVLVDAPEQPDFRRRHRAGRATGSTPRSRSTRHRRRPRADRRSTTAIRRSRGCPRAASCAGSARAASSGNSLDAMGFGRHFLYASSGPSVGQWLVATAPAGASSPARSGSTIAATAIGALHAGRGGRAQLTRRSEVRPLLEELVASRCSVQHLQAGAGRPADARRPHIGLVCLTVQQSLAGWRLCAYRGVHASRGLRSGVSVGSICSRRCSNCGVSDSFSPSWSSGSSTVKPGPIVAISNSTPDGSRK